jgi:NAD(P)H dehydrogenase (quinone)
MSNVNLAIIFYSSTGTNYQLTQWASEGARDAGAEVKILKVPELAPQSVIDSNLHGNIILKKLQHVYPLFLSKI